MKNKVLSVKKTGAESKVAIGEALPHQGGGQTSSGPTEKHDSKKAGKHGQPCQQREPVRILASE